VEWEVAAAIAFLVGGTALGMIFGLIGLSGR
jgi:hypothetical protein